MTGDPSTKKVNCPRCDYEQYFVFGEFDAVELDHGGIAIYEINMHGSVKLGEGESLAAALRDVADEVED